MGRESASQEKECGRQGRQGANGDRRNEGSLYEVSTSPRKRKVFTMEDEEIISEFFAKHLSTHQFPSIQECQELLMTMTRIQILLM